MVRNVTALDELPQVAEAATSGRISAVRVFVYGITHVGMAKMREFEDVFLVVALEHVDAETLQAATCADADEPTSAEPPGHPSGGPPA